MQYDIVDMLLFEKMNLIKSVARLVYKNRGIAFIIVNILVFYTCYIILYSGSSKLKSSKQKVEKLDDSNLKKLHFNKIAPREVKNAPDMSIKNQFDHIYKNLLWHNGKVDLEKGGGSGPGSSVHYTKNCRDIIYRVVKKYQISSILDAPCGSMSWIPHILYNITNENRDFRYYGVDVVESIINASRIRYSRMAPNWQMSVLDFTQQELPKNYDMIFSRDALQHLPLVKVVNALKMFSRTEGARYLLVGSYIQDGYNKNINIGDYYPVNLMLPPFNLTNFIEVFDEKVPDNKHLILYDIPNYLNKINFDTILSGL